MSLVLEHDNFEEHMKILAGQGIVVSTDKPIYTKDNATGVPVKILRAFLADNIGERSWFVCFADGSSSYYPTKDKSNFYKSYDISYVDGTYWEKKFRIKQVEHKAGLPELPEGLRWKVEVSERVLANIPNEGFTNSDITLKVVDSNNTVVVKSHSMNLPVHEERFYKFLGKMSSRLVVPEYNPYMLNW